MASHRYVIIGVYNNIFLSLPFIAFTSFRPVMIDEDNFVPPPPPGPPPPPTASFLKEPLQKDGKTTSLKDQIGESSSVIQAVAAAGWYDSLQDDKRYQDKSQTGLTGLSNQGRYINYVDHILTYVRGHMLHEQFNSELVHDTRIQNRTLYCTLSYYTHTLQWRYDPLGDGEKADCIPYQLQKLFARLQLSNKPFIETKELTLSFGWTEHDAVCDDNHSRCSSSNMMCKN